MHGRLKVRTTAEQEAIKKKERAEKLARYRAGMTIVFQKRKDKIYDDELMVITECILLQNPDIYTLWNIRREAFVTNDWDEKKLNESYKKELTFTENCLKENPKSYYVWYQRIWIINRLQEPDWKRELMLCTKCLNLDERNFHCWNYRDFIVRKAGISPEEEFNFATTKILNNFSNYSSWHYRSRILLKMFYNCDQQKIDERKKDELELVMNATFTDPSDSSAWFYQRWLLDTHERSSMLSQVLIKDNKVTLVTNQNVPDTSIYLQINKQNENIKWKAWHKTKLSKLWFGKFEYLNDIEEIKIEVEGNIYPLHYCNHKWIYKETKFKSTSNKEELLEQLLNYKQLVELEPNNKWALLTAVLLMRKIDFIKFYDDILKNLDILFNVDHLRFNYYKDLRSKYVIEYKLYELWNMDEDIKTEIDLSGLNLTTLGSNEYFGFFEEANLGANILSNSLHQLSLLQNCRKLSLSSNYLESIENFPVLQNLEVLSLRNNKLNSLEEILELLRKLRLKVLDLRENPVYNHNEFQNKIIEINPNLELCVE